MLCGYLTAIYLDMDIVISNWMWLLHYDASGLTDDISMCILAHIVAGWTGGITVYSLMSAFLVCANV